MKLPVYLGLLHRAEGTLASALRQVAQGHGAEPDVHSLCLTLATQCDEHVRALVLVVDRYGEADHDDEPERLHADGLDTTRSGPLGLLRDLQDVYLLATMVDITWQMIGQAGHALRDRQLLDTVAECSAETSGQLAWLRTRMRQAAPQALVAAS